MKKIIFLACVLMILLNFGTLNYAEITEDGLFDYEISYDDANQKYAMITDYNGKQKKVVIPSTFKVGNDIVPITRIGGGGGTFKWNHTVEEIVLPVMVKKIDGETFKGCTELKKITIPESTEYIGGRAFEQCRNLKEIFIPSKVKYIGNDAFSNCDRLEHIDVDGKNKIYSSTEGVIFTSNGKTLFRYPEGKSKSIYEIPKSVEKIQSGAFYNCDHLKQVTLSNQITEIGNGAFDRCDFLEEVEIPKNTKKLGNGAFGYCIRLKKITIFNPNMELGGALYFGSGQVVIYCYKGSTAHKYVMKDDWGSNRPWAPLPEVKTQIQDQQAKVGVPFNFAIPENTFNDTYGYDYKYTASNLPEGLSFDEKTKTISGIPKKEGVFDVSIEMSEAGYSVTDNFEIAVSLKSDNTAPIIKLAEVTGDSRSLTVSFESDEVGTYVLIIQNAQNTSESPREDDFTDSLYGGEGQRQTGSMLAGKNTIYITGLNSNTAYNLYLKGVDKSQNICKTPVVANASTKKIYIEGEVFIEGVPKYGESLKAKCFFEEDGYILQYKWKRSGKDISGEIGDVYKITADDIGHKINVEIQSKNTTGTVLSDPTETIKKADGPLQPPAPVLLKKTSSTIELKMLQTTYQYRVESVDGNEIVPWTDMKSEKTVLYNLSPKTEYQIYQRIKETKTTYPSAQSKALKVTTEDIQINKAPVLINPIPDQKAYVGVDFVYSIPKDTFNDDNGDDLKFSVSTPASMAAIQIRNKNQIFYHPTTEGAIHVTLYAKDGKGGKASDAFKILAEKLASIKKMSIKSVESRSAEIEFLVDKKVDYLLGVVPQNGNSEVMDWDKKGVIKGTTEANKRQAYKISQTFDGEVLQPGTPYTVYLRIQNEAGKWTKVSASFMTEKGTTKKPSPPEKVNVTYSQIVLKKLQGFEYSIVDGKTWQDEAKFFNLQPNTTYWIVQRKAESDITFASKKSDPLEIRTHLKPSVKDDSENRPIRQEKKDKDYDSPFKGELTVKKDIPEGITTSKEKLKFEKEIVVKQENLAIRFKGQDFEALKVKKPKVTIEKIDKTKLQLSKELSKKIGHFPIYDIQIYEDGKAISSKYKGRVAFEIPVSLPTVSHRVVPLYIDETGQEKILDGLVVNGVMKFFTNHLSHYTMSYENKTFKDVLGHWSQKSVEALSVRNMVKGKSKDDFMPDGIITRAEFTSMAIHFIGFETDDFENMKSEGALWHEKFMQKAQKEKLLPEKFDWASKPNESIKREEMMYMLYRAMEAKGYMVADKILENKSTLESYKDQEEISPYAIDGVKRLIDQGIVCGYNGNLYPKKTATRAEAAQMIYNAFAYIIKNG